MNDETHRLNPILERFFARGVVCLICLERKKKDLKFHSGNNNLYNSSRLNIRSSCEDISWSDLPLRGRIKKQTIILSSNISRKSFFSLFFLFSFFFFNTNLDENQMSIARYN